MLFIKPPPAFCTEYVRLVRLLDPSFSMFSQRLTKIYTLGSCAAASRARIHCVSFLIQSLFNTGALQAVLGEFLASPQRFLTLISDSGCLRRTGVVGDLQMTLQQMLRCKLQRTLRQTE